MQTEKFAVATEINRRLGLGINFQAVFEGSTLNSYNTNPALLYKYIDEIATLKFKHIRLTVNWEMEGRSSNVYPYTISPQFIQEIKRVIDYALQKRLIVILNMQNHQKLYKDPDGQKARFLTQWSQIATAFKDYPDFLLFEILNEPRGSITVEKWNLLFKEALHVIRETPAGSNNRFRTILIGTAHWGGPDYLKELDFPENDPYTILTIHYYQPHKFTHQNAFFVPNSSEWKGITWDDTEEERNKVMADFAYVIELNKKRNIPVNIGEFGSFSEADLNSRLRFTGFLMKWFTQQGFSRTFFNYLLNPGFGIYDVNNGYLYPLVKVVTDADTTLPPAHAPSQSTILYTSNIQPGNSDGWKFFEDSTGRFMHSVKTNEMEVDITRPGNVLWAINMKKDGFTFHKGKKYCVTFDAKSTAPFQRIQLFAGKTENSLFYPVKEFKKYSLIFTALENQDNVRLTFYLGGNASPSVVTIGNIRLKQFSY